MEREKKQIGFPQGCDSLLERCVHIMHTIDPIEKADLTLLLGQQWKDSNKNSNSQESAVKLMDIGRASPPDKPLRPDNLEFVRPGFGVKVGKAGSLSSRIAILHALANVEQWAIDTALDNMARFGYYTQATAGTALKGQIENEQEIEFVMPNRFFDDFMQMACDESKHFKWLNERLESQGAHYGDLPVHASIWDSCTDTARSALARMAVVHMTIESRGLDVNPATIARFERSGDIDSARMLQKIHDDEVTHVQIGHRWFCYLLKRHEGIFPPDQNGSSSSSSSGSVAFGAGSSDDADPDLYEFRQVTPAYAQKEDGTQGEEIVGLVEAQRRKRFQEVVVQYFKGSLKPPFNTVDREKGGMTRGWYEPLVVVRERTGFRPASGRRLQSKKEKPVEAVEGTPGTEKAAGQEGGAVKESEGNVADTVAPPASEAA
ncbi:hypothetical protein BGZ80_005357 [Entomortierella chlamydospora]|uniref:DUF455-domain-containing protein n=1 Tax=Entomortierella chlamydospora TaxID=101097 RepID=A0A9P6MJY2_9FUNG|nr:hypothetical protein BGZ79_007929 [Entomortierella chlamydospora]KAG0005980.1 hypothetical protein BGZ80_005357 [Entomortierella chlamydospora]